MNERRIIIPGQTKTIWSENSAFQQQLKLWQLKNDIKPRKYDVMRSQDSAAIESMIEAGK